MSDTFESDRLIMRGSDMSFLDAVIKYYTENREFFEKYEPSRGDLYYTRDYQTRLLEMEVSNMARLQSVYYYYFLKEDPDTVIGSISFSRIRREPYASTIFGYNIHEKYQGHGYCTEACKASIERVLQLAHIHRIECRVLTYNEKSIHVLERLGFFHEGFEKAGILIDGEFRDHLRYAWINENY
jgi:Acetyltransferases, including N-acetylases of ribosomal proteins